MSTEEDPALIEQARRERRRAEIVTRVPASYRHVPHLVIPTLLGLGVIACALFFIHALRPVELLAVPITLFAAFGFEWRVHKNVLHQRAPIIGELYERHELAHHVIFQSDDMAMRSTREMWLILMPISAIVIAFLVDLPVALGLGLLVSHNVGFLVLTTAMFFFLSYEWMHLAYHMPKESFIGRLWLIHRLRELHQRHHDPRLMKRWNFNVTLPVFDFLYGTLWSPEREAAVDSKRARRAGRSGQRSAGLTPQDGE